jgi:two-component system, NtrC family, nitrogen regulation sensor histidine kinase NtrY
MKKNGIKIIVTIILFVVLMTCNLIFRDYQLSLQNNPEKIIWKIESAISKKEKIAKANLENLIELTKQFPEETLFGFDKFSKVSEKEMISFQIYRNDSLVFWSDNKLNEQEDEIVLTSDSSLFQFNNGWYDIVKIKKDRNTFIAAILLKSEYKYENDYLVNEFVVGLGLRTHNEKITKNGKINLVKNSEGNNLFSITINPCAHLTSWGETIVIFIYLLEFIALLYLMYMLINWLVLEKRGQGLSVFLFIVSIVLLRVLLFFFKVPQNLYETAFFSPIYYASSEWLPSLGDLLLNTLLILIIAVILFKKLNPENLLKPKRQLLRLLLSLIVNLFSASLFFIGVSTIRSMVVDSTISFNLNQIFSINGLSLIGISIIAFLLLAYVLIASVLFRILQRTGVTIFEIFTGLVLTLLMLLLIRPLQIVENYQLIICFILFNLVYWLFRKKAYKLFHYYEIGIYLILFTFMAYSVITVSTGFKETENRKYFAQKLTSGEDPLAEYVYTDVQKNIKNDLILKDKLKNYPSSESDIKDYISRKYFTGFWDKYKVQITLCAENDSLKMATNSEHCYNYFKYLTDTIGKPTSCENLYLLNYGTGGYNYLSVFDFMTDSIPVRMFVEMNSKFIPKGLGYPELLIDKKLFINSDLTNYSYAKYYGNTLVDAFGKYYYSVDFKPASTLKVNDYIVFNDNGYNHLLYKVDPTSFIIISKKQEGILDLLAPFSILFSFFVVVLLLFILLLKSPINLKQIRLDFKNRLQIAMVSIILFSFIIIGVSTYVFIKNLNNNKNIDILSEKSMSVEIELQKKLSDTDTMNPDQMNVLSAFLAKLSNVFFTDVNVFDTRGNLVSSSRPQIFDEGLISTRMNPTAFFQLKTAKKTFYIQKEYIGKLEYYSAYVPFYNRDNKAVYYINLPYFAKQSELKKELSSFLMAFVNIYVFFIAISIVIALFVAGRITRPLNVIRDKIGNIKLGSKNEKINWPRRDEIGGLIDEYNRMIDEIAESANLLARSERESAWREMAMQVAHEIKNPLTPMKLSIQYLDKAWKEQAPDWDAILRRFSKNMVEQIDSLSAIASEFSYFAKMPAPKNELIDVLQVIESSMAIFSGSDKIKIDLLYQAGEKYPIFTDKKQVVRVMNNLLDNAVQAIGDRKDGTITIKVELSGQKVLIAVSDNGDGIPDEMKDKVFVPSFSTKTEGMGLGLAIVRGIVENSGGRIWFESKRGEGSTFFIEWPKGE